KALAAFRRPPHDDQAGARDDALHAIIRRGRERDRFERSEMEADSATCAAIPPFPGALFAVGFAVGLIERAGIAVTHAALSPRMTMSLKSAPIIFGVRRMTSRPASIQRRAHAAAAPWPAPLASLSTSSVSVSMPGSTGK